MDENIETLKQLYNTGYIYVNCGNTIDKAIAGALARLSELEKENKEIERKYIWRKLMYDRLVKENRKLKENKDILETNYETLRGDIQSVVNELGFPEDTIISDEFVPMIKENYIPKSVIREKIETKCQELQHRTNIEKILECEFQRLKKEILGEEK